MLAIGDIEFVSIAAAAFGIGVRFASVWAGVRAFVDDYAVTIADQPTAGSVHHGATGVALAAAGATALVGRALGVEVVPTAVAAAAVDPPASDGSDDRVERFEWDLRLGDPGLRVDAALHAATIAGDEWLVV
ncbi:hypothetical protein, partial [Halobellus sp. Atlit-38R]|uniref:hypothetical protein n=1 Tax=Halobellus sp. Atlit-38R TaxID=2282131 RepID=UPI001F3A9B14